MGTLTSAIYPRYQIYTVGATPSAGPFPIPFPFQDHDEVVVWIDRLPFSLYEIAQPSPDGVTGNALTLNAPVSNAIVVIAWQ